ncbi:MAG TPA: ABC transporter permease [Vicinamibacterales bacterium]|jgi:predicted permease
MLREFRHASRTLVSGRLFTVVAVLCLASGIASNTTMFSVFDAMFLRPLPFKDGDRLVSISGRHPDTGRRVALTAADVRELTDGLTSFDAMAASAGRTASLIDGGDPERIGVQQIAASLFPMLGVTPQRGRPFEPADDQASAAGVALISDSLWHRRYQADPNVLGRLIRLDTAAYMIVGVMPPKFRFPSTSELWIPLGSSISGGGSSSRTVSILGRLAPGVTLDQANAELASRVLPARDSRGPRAGTARPFRSTGIGSEERTITGALMGATTVLLLMACVNVANLLLARGAGRRREIAVRAALGASRGRIIRQLLSESILLSLTAAALALPLAWYGIRWVHEAVPPSEPLGPYYVDWSLDARTFVYSLSIALITGLAFGLAPALDATGRRILNPLRASAGVASSRVQRRVHGVLIVAQLALAVVLLAGASLFVRTYVSLSRVELGYDTSSLMTLRVYFAGAQYDSADARAAAVDQIAARLAALPSAHAATVADLVPLDDQGGSDAPADVEGRTFEKGSEPEVHYAGVAGRWPETFDLRLVSGRTFYPDELLTAAPVALVNAKLASTFWPGANPLGRRFRLADEASNPWLSVIGVVPDIRTVKLDESRSTPPTAYVPHRFISTRNYGIVVRSRSEPAAVIPEVRTAVRTVDPSLALFDVYPMEQVRWLSYWMYVMWGTMFGVFGFIALLIAAVGVYGVVFYTVAQRTREVGLRVALGASRTQVVGPMLRQVGLQSAIGLTIGLAGAVFVTPVVRSLLLGVTPNDPAGLAVVSILLAAIALVATWVPAWRASAVDPMLALRDP